MEDPPDGAMDGPPPSKIVDARGHRCPVPTLRLRRALESMAAGERVLLLADDPMARVDVPYFVGDQRHLLLDRSEEGATLRFLIEKS